MREHIVLDPLHSVMFAISDDACEIQARSIDKVSAAFNIVFLDSEAEMIHRADL